MTRRRTLLAGVVGGLVHFVVVGGLYVYFHGPELFGYSTHSHSFGLLQQFTIFIIFGAFILGVVPAVLLVEWRLITPTLTIIAIVVGILLLSPHGFERTPRADGPPGFFAFYFVWWFAPVFLACLFGGIEYAVRKLIRQRSPAESTANS